MKQKNNSKEALRKRIKNLLKTSSYDASMLSSTTLDRIIDEVSTYCNVQENKEKQSNGTVSSDFSSIKSSKETLDHLINLFKKTQTIAHVGSWEFDVLENRLYWSDEIFNIFGLEPNKGSESYEFFLSKVHPDDRDAVSNTYINSMKDGKDTYEIEHRIICSSTGEVRFVYEKCYHERNAEGRVVLSVGIVQDITERKRAEEKQVKEKEYLQTILQTTVDGFWVVDSKGIIVDVNEAYCKMSGYAKHELVNSSISKVDVIESFDETQARIQRIIRNGMEVFETRHKKKDGHIFDIEMSVTYINIDGGKFVCFGRNISQRKLWEQQLVLSDRIFNHALDMLCIAGYDGYFKVLNPSWSKVLGWSIEEMLAKPWVDFVHPDDRDATQNIRSILVDGDEIYQFENRYICKDGSIKWLSWNSYPYPAESIMFGVARDISFKKQAEENLFKSDLKLKEQVEEYTALTEELNQSNEELRNIMDELTESNLRTSALVAANPDLMFVYSRHGEFLDYHAPKPGLLLLKPEAFLNKSVHDVLPEYLAKVNQEAINKLFETGIAQNYSYSLEVNGMLSHFDARMVKYGKDKALAIVRDITAEKQAEIAIAKSDEKFRLLVKNSSDTISILTVEGKQKYISQVVERITGYTAEELLGSRIDEVIHPDDLQSVMGHWNELLANPQKIQISQYRHIHKTQGWVYLEAVGQNFLAEPSVNGIVLSVRDISERKQAESELLKSNSNISFLAETALSFVNITTIGDFYKFIGESIHKLNPSAFLMVNSVNYSMGNLKTEAVYGHHNLIDKVVSLLGYSLVGKTHSINKSVIKSGNGKLVKVEGGLFEFCIGNVPLVVCKTIEKLFDINSIYGLAILADNEIVASVGMVFQKGNDINNIETLETFIKQASIAYKRIKVEEELRQSEERYRSLYESTPAMLHSIDKEGRIISVSNTWLNKLGYTKDEVLGKKSIDFLTDESKREAQEVYLPEFFSKGISKDASYQMVTKSGEVLDVLMSAVAEKSESEGFVRSMAVIEDITERKQAEKALRASEEMMRSSQSVAHICSYSTNLNVKEIEKSSWVCSPEFYEIFGINKTYPHTIEGWANLIHPDYRKEVFAYHESVVKEKKPFNREYKIVRINDGAERWVMGTGELVYNEQGNPVRMYGAIQDITERKLAEQALKQSEESFRGLYENATVGIYRTTPQGEILMANPTLVSMLGYNSFDELACRNLELDGYEPEYPRSSFQQQIEANGEVRAIESAWKLKNGQTIYVLESARVEYNDQGKPLYYEGIVENITERKKAEEVTRMQEGRIKSIFRVAPTGIGVVKDRVITEVNPRLCEMVGYAKEELIGQSSRMLYFSQDDYDFVGNEKYRQIALNGTGTVETRWVRKNGVVIDIILSSTPISDENLSLGVTFTAMDITQRKKVEHDLLVEESKYRLLFENMTQGFALHEIVVDENNSPCDYRYLSVNPAFEQLTGLKSSNLIGKTVLEVMPNTEKYWIETYARVSETGDSIRYENFAAELGKYFDVSAFCPQKGQFAVVFSDITNRKLAEEKVLKLSKGIEQGPAIVVITDLNGVIEYVNPKFTEVSGYSLNEAIGQNPKLLKSGHHNTAFYQHLWSTITGGNDWRGEILNKKKNGEEYWESALISPVKNEKGEIINFIAIKEDITERKKAEEALKQNELVLKEKNEEYLALNEELVESNERISKINTDLVVAREKAEESDRLKTAFLANMSHEIRTPMNAIIGFSEVLLKPTLSPEKQKFFTNVLNEACQQLLTVVNDVIDISKVETKQVKLYKGETDLNKLLQKSHSIYSTNAEKKGNHISLVCSLPADDCTVITDETKLSQIINNLLSNAIKFTNDGEIEMGYSVENQFLIFYVKDSGIGISPTHHSIVFERFRQVEVDDSRKYGGTGLGLSISKAFVELMGGQIWVESELGKGATFYFTIPYIPVKMKIQKEKFISSSNFNFSGKTLLLAEDEYANYILINDWIEGANAKVVYAANGLEAVSAFEKNPEIDLVLMDIKMPEMNGFEATKVIKAINKNVPVIALTAYAMAGDKEKCLEVGCNSYLSKPLKRQELLSLIASYFV